MKKMIEAVNISKSFGKQQVFADLSISANKGEWLCVYGDSGCGKTTLINTLAGLTMPDNGTVSRYTERIGFAFQDDRLLEWKSSLDNIVFVLRSQYERSVCIRESKKWLDKVGLGNFAERKPPQLSGGMRRRLNIARALAVKPDILFLDEPFAFLDKANAITVRNLIVDAVKKMRTTVIMVTHSLDELKEEMNTLKGEKVLYCLPLTQTD